jgi:uncharacterized RDD family membrane protein YckC
VSLGPAPTAASASTDAATARAATTTAATASPATAHAATTNAATTNAATTNAATTNAATTNAATTNAATTNAATANAATTNAATTNAATTNAATDRPAPRGPGPTAPREAFGPAVPAASPPSPARRRPEPVPVVLFDVVGVGRQIAAALVDAAGSAATATVLVVVALRAFGLRASAQTLIDAIHRGPTQLLPGAVAVVVGVLLWGLASVPWGATPGQRLCGVQLVTKEGAAPSRHRLVVRAVVDTAATLAFLAGPAWALFLDRLRRTPGDRIAGTVAVRR